MSKKFGEASKHYKIKPNLKVNPDPGKWNSNCTPVDALHPDRIGDNLPSLKETLREAEYVSTIADTASRARSGGTWQTDKNSNLPLVLPRGMGVYKDFHNRFTREPEKKEEKKPLALNPNAATRRYEGPAFKTISLPETFCALCCKKDVKPGEGMLNTSPVAEPWEGLGIKYGDVLRYVFCYHCTKEMKKKGSNLKVMTVHGLIPLGLIKAIERSRKIDKNVERFLRAAKLAQTPGVFEREDERND